MKMSEGMLYIGLILFLQVSSEVSAFEANCPASCNCNITAVSCVEKKLTAPPDFTKPLTNPTILDLSGNDMVVIRAIDFSSTKLQYLYLNENIIAYIDDWAFSALPNLEYLDLSNNRLTELPSQFLTKNYHMKKLNVSGNYFDLETPAIVSGTLEVLDLSLCEIKTFTSRNIIRLPNLKVLLLHANYLTNIDANIFKDTKLKHVNLSFNLWECDYATKRLFEYLIKQKLMALHWTIPSCPNLERKVLRRKYIE